MKKLISFVLTILLFLSCSEENKFLREALKAAGDNRSELEAVLEHYRTVDKDPQKLEAAKYLIANMPAHYSYRDEEAINNYYDIALQILGTGPSPDWQRDTLRQISDSLFVGLQQDRISDVEVITGDYLIRSIDHAFNQWKSKPWAKYLTYEQFCEWLLPYKVIEGQSFDDWRNILSSSYCDSLSTVPSMDVERNSTYGAIEIVRNEIHTKQSDRTFKIFWEDRGGIPLLSAETWNRMTFGSCWDFVNMGVAVFRSLGIPAAVDVVPKWGRNADGHSWYVFPSDRGKEETAINSLINPAGMQFYPYERIPKVFRKTYRIDKDRLEYSKNAKYVYPLDLCAQDVTDHYNATSDIDIVVKKGIKLVDKYVYIAMFSLDSKGQWMILDIGKMKRGKAHFKNMGRNMLYIALGHNGRALVPISDPFLLYDDGKIEYISYDDSDVRNVTLKRKYYESYNVVTMRRRLLDGKIQCATRPDFSDAKTLYTIETTDIPDRIAVESGKPYRYWRYLSADGSYGSVAELAFFNQNGELLNGRGMANAGAGKDVVAMAFDNNWLTNFETEEPDGNWVGVDLGTPREVSSVRIVPRSDDNDIHPGQEYELCYLDSRGRWKSFAKKTAEGNALSFVGVPKRCFLWLINHTTGMDERPFLMNEDGTIEWW